MNDDGLVGLIMVLLVVYLVINFLMLILLGILMVSAVALTLFVVVKIFRYGIPVWRWLITGKYREVFEDIPGIGCALMGTAVCVTVTTLIGLVIPIVLAFQHKIFVEVGFNSLFNDTGSVILILWVAILGGAYLGIVGTLTARESYLVGGWIMRKILRKPGRSPLPLGTVLGAFVVLFTLWQYGTTNWVALGIMAIATLVVVMGGWSLVNLKEWKVLFGAEE